MTMLCIVQGKDHQRRLTPTPIPYEDALRLARRTVAEGMDGIVRVYEAGPNGDVKSHRSVPCPAIFMAYAGSKPGEWWWLHIRDGYQGQPQPGQPWQLQEPASPLP